LPGLRDDNTLVGSPVGSLKLRAATEGPSLTRRANTCLQGCFDMALTSFLTDPLQGIAQSFSLPGSKSDSSNAFADKLRRAQEAQSDTIGKAQTSAGPAELTREAETQFSAFKRNMRQLLQQSGIDLTWEVRLSTDGAGGILVEDMHPDKEKIEQLLRENPDLVQQFKQLQSSYERLRQSSAEATPQDSLTAPRFVVSFVDEQAHASFE